MVRAEEGPSQPVQDHPEGSTERLPPGLLHRRESGPLPACSGCWEPSPFSTACASPGWVATARLSAGRWWARAWPAWTTGSPRPPPLGRSQGPDHVQTPAPRSLPCAASGPRGLGGVLQEASGGTSHGGLAARPPEEGRVALRPVPRPLPGRAHSGARCCRGLVPCGDRREKPPLSGPKSLGNLLENKLLPSKFEDLIGLTKRFVNQASPHPAGGGGAGGRGREASAELHQVERTLTSPAHRVGAEDPPLGPSAWSPTQQPPFRPVVEVGGLRRC